MEMYREPPAKKAKECPKFAEYQKFLHQAMPSTSEAQRFGNSSFYWSFQKEFSKQTNRSMTKFINYEQPSKPIPVDVQKMRDLVQQYLVQDN